MSVGKRKILVTGYTVNMLQQSKALNSPRRTPRRSGTEYENF